MTSPQYEIVRDEDGRWHLYRNQVRIDTEHDPERAALAEIFRWASAVVAYEDRVEVARRASRPTSEGRVRYVAEISRL